MDEDKDFVLPCHLQNEGISIAVEAPHPAKRLPRQLLKHAVAEVLSSEGVTTAHITIVLCDDAMIRAINARFLQHDWPTDVISFPLRHQPLEGEIYISVDTAQQQAADYGVGLANELVRLAVHGVLHLLGYDDDTDDGRAQMQTAQECYVARIMEQQKRRRNLHRAWPRSSAG